MHEVMHAQPERTHTVPVRSGAMPIERVVRRTAAPQAFPPKPAGRCACGGGCPACQARLQAKLVIGPVNDPLEREADHIAGLVTAPGALTSPVQPSSTGNCPLQRACACGGSCGCGKQPEDEEPLQRQASGVTTPESAPPSVATVLGSSGRSLPEAVRREFEPRFGHDFSRVRVHADPVAAQSAAEVQALAYTVGQDIVFGAGQFAPESFQGRRLIAHELVHVVQQSTTQEAWNLRTPPLIQRFGSQEHVEIGNRVQPGQSIDIGAQIGRVSYGELIALSGDYFESIDQIIWLSMDQSGRDQISFALWKVNPSGRQKPVAYWDVEQAVMNRYYTLAAKNETHFSVGSAPGRSNRETYIAEHSRAITAAYTQGSTRIIRGGPWQAREAFASHFLTDAFSGGHIRTERGEIQRYWNGKYPNFKDNLIRLISCYMASYINDRDAIGWPASVSQIADGIPAEIRKQAGAALDAFSIGDLIAKVLHDFDNKGLNVTSSRPSGGSIGASPFAWRAVGDDYLFRSGLTDPAQQQAQRQTQQMVVEAALLSFEETQSAFAAGTSYSENLDQLVDPKNFRALALIPSNGGAPNNPNLAWTSPDVRTLPYPVPMLLSAAFSPGGEIREELDQLVIPPITTVTRAHIDFDLHTGEAWDCFKSRFLANILGTIYNIAEGKNLCPPGNDNPCPTP
jgi:hypothetical protein